VIVPLESGVSPAPNLKSRALDALASLPPFSPILTRLLASLTGEEVSFSKLGDLIEKDTVLAGNLLSIVNSALYARRSTIVSVRHAVALLGINKLRNAVLAMSISRMWNKRPVPASWSMTRFNTHSVACGILSDLLAQRLPVSCGEGAFIGGLLHDIGQMLVGLSLPRQHEEVLRLRMEGERNGIECEQEVLGFTHPELSSEALGYWKLPAPVLTAVLYHHAPGSDKSRSRPGEITLSQVIEAANNYVNSVQISIFATGISDSSDPSLLESMVPDETQRATILEEFKTEYDVMLQFFR